MFEKQIYSDDFMFGASFCSLSGTPPQACHVGNSRGLSHAGRLFPLLLRQHLLFLFQCQASAEGRILLR